jgi:hypothetical protein
MAKKLFISYSHKDSAFYGNLKTHLSPLTREGLVEFWGDTVMDAGERPHSTISEKLEKADIFIAMVSPDFLASNYCYEIELKRALDREREGTLRVIPLILRACDWLETPLKDLKALPEDGVPIVKWKREDDAYLQVATALRKIIAPSSDASQHHTALLAQSGGTQVPKSTTRFDNVKLEGSKTRVEISKGGDVYLSNCKLTDSTAEFVELR